LARLVHDIGHSPQRCGHDDKGSKTMFDFTTSDAKRIFLATVGGLLMSLACLTAALAPANAATAHAVEACRPTLL
jgi:hypothetical protein